MDKNTIKWLADTQVIRRADSHKPEMPSNWVWVTTNKPVTKAQIEVVTEFLEFLRLHKARLQE